MTAGGAEHLKQRVSEHMSRYENPTKQSSVKMTHTLTGNWAEDRFDSKFMATGGKRAALPTALDHSWQTNYATGNKEADERHAAHDPQLTHSTRAVLTMLGSMPSGTALGPQDVTQERLVDIVDGRQRAYPGHQPELDPAATGVVGAPRTRPPTSETRTSYIPPVQQRVERAVNAKDLFTGPAHDKPGFVLFKIRNDFGQRPPAPRSNFGPRGPDPHVAVTHSYPALRRTLLATERHPPVPLQKKDGRLTLEELAEGLTAYGVRQEPAEVTALFKRLDTLRTGEVAASDVVHAVRGEMNDRRRKVTLDAYALLKATVAREAVAAAAAAGHTQARLGTAAMPGTGFGGLAGVDAAAFQPTTGAPGSAVAVRMRDVLRLFDAAAHPSVVEGHITAAQAREAIFEEHHADPRPADAKEADLVTQAAFVEWYEDWSALVAADHYFEKTVRDCWHVSGGTGLAANTSCRRVTVTHTNGRVTKQEVVDDLGVPAEDIAQMTKILARQGIDDVKRIAF